MVQTFRFAGRIAAAGLIASPVLVATAPAASAAEAPSLVAVTGTNAQVYVRRSSETGWTGMGGRVDGAPSVTTAPEALPTSWLVRPRSSSTCGR